MRMVTIPQRSEARPGTPTSTGVDHLLARVETSMRNHVDAPADQRVSRAARYHLDAGGKRVRARVACEASLRLGLDDEVAVAIATGVELLHNATLVHDDLQDDDSERRGQATVVARFGADVALLAGDLMLSAAPTALWPTGGPLPLLLQRMHARVGQLVRGQAADLALGELAGRSEYLQIAEDKCGPLFGLPVELPLLAAGFRAAADVAARAGELFAVGYQAADDLDDVERDAASGSPNAVSLLAREGLADPRTSAAQLARTHVVAAIAVAESLPRGAGTGLIALAERLVADLDTRART